MEDYERFISVTSFCKKVTTVVAEGATLGKM